ncbi:DUF2269 domain-containing protein [Dactylosporangium sp. NPDC005572]|uniref:DUF2269 domain-containing protein n=1 Tax=Dactylosporangium sp. NPDC005572 TaxID=3156889 RepID=UPI0033A4E32A
MRRLALVLHVAASVGWLGAVVTSLALGVVALTSGDAGVVRGVYLVLEPAGWATLVPFSLAGLATGLVQSIGTGWGLVRHYWVLVKLLLNLFATAVLLLYMQTLATLADLARDPGVELAELRTVSPVVHAGAAVALLLVALVLSVYKPRGVTPWAGPTAPGRRRHTPPPARRGPAVTAS